MELDGMDKPMERQRQNLRSYGINNGHTNLLQVGICRECICVCVQNTFFFIISRIERVNNVQRKEEQELLSRGYFSCCVILIAIVLLCFLLRRASVYGVFAC